VERRFIVPIFEVTTFQCAIGNSKQRHLSLQFSQSDPTTTKSLLLRAAVMLPQIDGPSEYPSMVDNRPYHQTEGASTGQDRGTVYLLRSSARTADHCNVGKGIIEILHEDILLEIFGFYVFGCDSNWQTLVHVCRRWRSIVFAAPPRLNLRLVCTGRTPARKMWDIWPALPIAVWVYGTLDPFDRINDNILDALEAYDRICEVHVNNISDSEISRLARAMRVTFPKLTHLDIVPYNDTGPLPKTFLRGSAPKLQSLRLEYITFPTLPKLLLSSPGLVTLSIFGISHSDYIPSDAMADCLSSLTRLEHLQLEFLSPPPRPDSASRRPPPLTRTVFPVLATLLLQGVTEYLDQLLACVEAPHINVVRIQFLDPPIFDISRISPCIGPTETFETFDEAYMLFHGFHFRVVLSSRNGTTGSKTVTLSLKWKDSGWTLEELFQNAFEYFHRSPQPFDLCDLKGSLPPSWAEIMGNLPWLHLLRFFTATEYMYLFQGLGERVAPALQELTGAGATEVLPVLRNIFVERLDSLGAVQEAIGQFVAARQLLSGHRIDVQCWRMGEIINRTDQDVGDDV